MPMLPSLQVPRAPPKIDRSIVPIVKGSRPMCARLAFNIVQTFRTDPFWSLSFQTLIDDPIGNMV